MKFRTENPFSINKSNENRYQKKADDNFPIIIRLVKNNFSNEKEKSGTKEDSKVLHYYFLSIKKDEEVYKLHLDLQNLEKNNESFEIEQIYGIDNSGFGQAHARVEDQDKECIICFTDKIDTIILPCRHMSICLECAQSLQNHKKEHSRKCPVCRTGLFKILLSRH